MALRGSRWDLVRASFAPGSDLIPKTVFEGTLTSECLVLLVWCLVLLLLPVVLVWCWSGAWCGGGGSGNVVVLLVLLVLVVVVLLLMVGVDHPHQGGKKVGMILLLDLDTGAKVYYLERSACNCLFQHKSKQLQTGVSQFIFTFELHCIC